MTLIKDPSWEQGKDFVFIDENYMITLTKDTKFKDVNTLALRIRNGTNWVT